MLPNSHDPGKDVGKTKKIVTRTYIVDYVTHISWSILHMAIPYSNLASLSYMSIANVILNFCRTCLTMFLVRIWGYNHMVLNHGQIRGQAFGLSHSSTYRVFRLAYRTSKGRPNTSWYVINMSQNTHNNILYSFLWVFLHKYIHVSMDYINVQFGIPIGKLNSQNHICVHNDCISFVKLCVPTCL